MGAAQSPAAETPPGLQTRGLVRAAPAAGGRHLVAPGVGRRGRGAGDLPLRPPATDRPPLSAGQSRFQRGWPRSRAGFRRGRPRSRSRPARPVGTPPNRRARPRSRGGSLRGSPRRAARFPPATHARLTDRRGAGPPPDDAGRPSPTWLPNQGDRQPPTPQRRACRRHRVVSSGRWLEAVPMTASA